MAPVAERSSRNLGDERPNTSEQLKAAARREKEVALAERMRSELQI